MKYDSLLPIGSIVYVDGKNLMIGAYVSKPVDNENYDYVSFVYPFGVSEQSILLKKDDIERVKFIGFQNEDFVNLKASLEKKND